MFGLQIRARTVMNLAATAIGSLETSGRVAEKCR
jgi:hypothetical protein